MAKNNSSRTLINLLGIPSLLAIIYLGDSFSNIPIFSVFIGVVLFLGAKEILPLLKFKKGAFHIAKNTGARIVPVIINGAYEAKNKKDWRLYPGVIDIYFSEIIFEDFYKDMSVGQLKDYVRERIKDFVD